MKGQRIIYLTIIGFLSGCTSSGYGVTYNTEPSGASIICNGINKGYSPVRLNYSPNKENKKHGSMNTVPCKAIWSSGASENFSTTWDLNKFPDGVRQTLPRPNVSGYAQDANFALQVQSMKAQQNQADAAQSQANTAAWQAIEQQRKNNKPITCTTLYGVTTCN
ncbi:MAG: cation transport regulator ChaB [Paraglaciecola sp.]|jgi:cation transport regulator ChaB